MSDLADRILNQHAPTDPMDYDRTIVGFSNWLPVLKHFKPIELLRPVVGPIGGPRVPIPPRAWWHRLLRLGIMADAYRAAAGMPVRVRYLWRGRTHNLERKGAPQSDHITAHGIDLQVRGDGAAEATGRARDAVVWPLYADHRLGVSVGSGATITHVGILSPSGRRRWEY